MAVLPSLTCETPPTFCNDPLYESDREQRYLLLQLLAALAVSIRAIESANQAVLLAAASAWKCASGNDPLRLRMMEAATIAANLSGALTEQPVCLDPLDQEAVIAYLICVLATSMAPVEIL